MRRTLLKLVRTFLGRRNRALIPTMLHLGRPRYIDVMQSEYTNEYVRLSQLDLAIHEIRQLGIAGDVAEVGVYKGDFAAVLNEAFPERKLYLFDTFEGFPSNQELADVQRHGLNHKRDFSDTNADLVLRRMAHPDRCIIRKGIFPATAAGVEDSRFCFVSLDADLYEPIRQGLDFFFDRMLPGGFVFVHDYNDDMYPGPKQAVLEFAEKRGVPFVPVTDCFGTAIFRR